MYKVYNFIFTLIFAFFSCLPLQLRIFCGKFIGFMLRCCRFRRSIVRSNLNLVYSARGETVPKNMEKKIYRHFGLLVTEFLAMPGLSDARMRQLFRLKGSENIDAALAEGKGVIMVAGHLGNWEMTMAAFAAQGYKVNVVVKSFKGVDCDFIFHQLRGKRGVKSLLKENASLNVIKALKRGEIVILVLDQNSKTKEGVFADFLGTSCCTYVSPAYFAHRTGAVVVTAYSRRQDDLKTCEAEISPPIQFEYEKKPSQEALQSTTQVFLQSLEPFFEHSPEQWIWMHKRWRTRPPGDDRKIYQ